MNHFLRGWLAVVVVSLVTLVLYILSKPAGIDFSLILLTVVAQILGLLAATFLSLNFILATRTRTLERYFGGLDKLSSFHHLLGTTAFVLMLSHPLSMVFRSLNNPVTARLYLIPNTLISYDMGILAVYSTILILLFTFVIRLPYHHWLNSHRFLGIPLIFVWFHTLIIDSDISFYLPLKLWIIGLLTAALISYFYKVFLYPSIGPKFIYRISRIKKLSSIFEIYLTPVGTALNFRPGQFIFISFPEMGAESHPFSLSSSPQNSELRLSVKILGDYTAMLDRLRTGMKAVVLGPYGQFYQAFTAARPLVMAAGGIGITPFLGMLNYELKNPQKRPITLYYAVTSKKEAAYLPELESIAAKSPRITVVPYFSDSSGYLTAAVITKNIPDLNGVNYLLCGPKPFMNSLSAQLQTLGVKKTNLYYEDFTLNPV